MPGEDQERVEDYLELQRYIEELQTGRAAHFPEQMTPEQARIYHMAALFRSATTESVEPRPVFVEQLEARLLAQLESVSQKKDIAAGTDSFPDEEMHNLPEIPVELQSLDVQLSEHSEVQSPSSPGRSNVSRTRTRFSRRNMLAGAAAVAASLGIGAGVGYTIERTGNAGNAGETGEQAKVANKLVWDPKVPLVGDVPTTWLEVTSLAQLGDGGAVRFVTDTLVGYAVKLVTTNEVIAVSAACTHMGCLVNWQGEDRRFHCPCHSGLFEASGEQANSSEYGYNLAPLPRLKTKVENGLVYVEVPRKASV